MAHPTKQVLNPKSQHHVDIDVMLAPLIEQMWRFGIETIECCQHIEWFNKPDYAGIWLELKQFQRLSELVLRPKPKYQFVMPLHISDWVVKIHVDGMTELGTAWFFPQSHIQEITKSLKDKRCQT